MNGIAIEARASRAIEEKVFPGCVIGIVNAAGNRDIFPFGKFTYEPDSRHVQENTVYDVASVTKTIPLALIALTFIEQGKLSLDDRVIDYLPEITIKDAEKGLIRHLLTYTYALQKSADPNFSYEHSTAKDIFDFLYKREFDFLPGTRYRYTNAPANLLGIILERISGKPLYSLAREVILEPLKMENSTFHPSTKSLIPPTEITSWRGSIQGEVHDETAFILEKEGFDPGCTGLFSSAGDLLNVAEMLLNQGVFDARRAFTSETLSLMTTNALADIGEWSGIGWELNQPKFMGSHAHDHMIGKTGFTGTCCVIDPKRGVAAVTLSNRTYPKRPVNSDAINAFRRDIADIVFGS